MKSKTLLLLLIITTNLGIFFLIQTTLPFDDFIFKDLESQLNESRIKEILTNSSKWEWVNYLILPVVQLIKLGLILACLKTGSLIFGIKTHDLFKIVLQAEFVFILLVLIKYIWFLVNKETLTLEYIQTFSPLSLSNFFHVSEINKWVLYPLQTINAFEVTYWITLSWLISKEFKMKFWKSFEFVMSTYGLGLLVWIVFVMFLSINMS